MTNATLATRKQDQIQIFLYAGLGMGSDLVFATRSFATAGFRLYPFGFDARVEQYVLGPGLLVQYSLT